VNCRIQWIIESLNAPCASWYSERHACLSVIKFSTSETFFVDEAWMWRFCWLFLESTPLKCISGDCFVVHIGVIIISAIVDYELVWCSHGECTKIALSGSLWLTWVKYLLQTVLSYWTKYLIILTSNQVGLPAELKHINKRRKRN